MSHYFWKMKHLFQFVALAAGLFLLWPASVLHACEPPVCWGTGVLPIDGAKVPENLKHVLTWAEEPPKLQRTSGNNGGHIKVVHESKGHDVHLTKIAEGWKVGEKIRAESKTCKYMANGFPANWTIVASAPLPKKLGSLSIKTHKKSDLKVSTNVGSCDVTIEADQVTIALNLHPSAQPWMDVFHFQTLVDGKKWRPSKTIHERSYGQSWEGRGKERLFSDCKKDSEANDNLSAGKHSVVLLATLPGMKQEWRTEAIEVNLSCDGAASPK